MPTLSPLHQRLARELEQRDAAGTRRRLTLPAAGLIDFSSNDYLGLSRHPAVQQALHQAAEAGAGSTGSRLLTGNSAEAEALEQHLAQFHRAEAALLFNSGYAANLGFFAAVPRRGDTILYDEASHASVKDGIRSSFATAWSFRHNDVADLTRRLTQLQRAAGATVFVAVEAVYSMRGDVAPLQALVEVCESYGAQLVVDEAHSVGVFGAGGEGLVTELHLEEQVLARVVTFGKALGGQGAAVAGPAILRDYLLNFSRPFIYTTALPRYTIAALLEAYRLLPEQHAARARLLALSDYLRRQLQQVPQVQVPADSRIIHPVQLPGFSPMQVRALAETIRAAGFDVRAIVPPTVPSGQQCLRVIVHSFNSEAEIKALVVVLKQAVTHEQ
ncbi:aminotransferase class I/II-fold pyridoxal phosphate-dependent enzyme [Hymenobacter psychrotolerans]|uniref:8-amino-7-oxononanoate synthase n=1 Tax=Hymenobacter psychrotolerans DSM 18569 TaxID=1121959 RepID=A0A1M6W912_9BACT|nr:8-amino-7-oxononanoate synthase [Hymenobacter psychrotolerans]SHK90282.1 8-amino-7-oxononanoate synthase [Hymenobacter psychrotolerans DSM 18569]